MTANDIQHAHQAADLLGQADALLQQIDLPTEEAALDLYHEAVFDLTECREKIARLLVDASLTASS